MHWLVWRAIRVPARQFWSYVSPVVIDFVKVGVGMFLLTIFVGPYSKDTGRHIPHTKMIGTAHRAWQLAARCERMFTAE